LEVEAGLIGDNHVPGRRIAVGDLPQEGGVDVLIDRRGEEHVKRQSEFSPTIFGVPALKLVVFEAPSV
jgi:hypothetical protein